MASSTSDLARTVRDQLQKIKANLARKKSPWLITSEIPPTALLTTLLDVVYYTSLKTEEGKPIVTRLCLVNPLKPEDSPPPRPRLSRWRLVPLADRIPLTVPAVVKIAKAADPWTSALAVYFDTSGDFYIWALIDQTVHWNRMLVREGVGYHPPGLINVVANGVADLSVYREHSFLARLQQDTLIESQNDVFWHGPVGNRLALWTRLFRDRVKKRVPSKIYNKEHFWDATFNDLWIGSLCRILISIQRYRHGGAILLTPETKQLYPHYRITYDRLPKHLEEMAVQRIDSREAGNSLRRIIDDKKKHTLPVLTYLDESIAESIVEDLEESLTGTVHFISSLSCVDGLVQLKPDLTVTGYGVEIRTSGDVEQVRVSLSPQLSPKTSRVVEANHFGTRHRSMMRYCFFHPSSLGFVISQDGDIRAIMKVRGEIVMWDNLKVHLLWGEHWAKALRTRSKKKHTKG